jgi:hypothetical protein
LAPDPYPLWKSYPTVLPAPAWAEGVLEVFRRERRGIDSNVNLGVKSNDCLAIVRPGLEGLGFVVEGGEGVGKIKRPVLFGENGETEVSYEVDGFLPKHGVVLEIEAGRGAANNADYRNLVRAGLMVDADYLVMAMMQRYVAGGQQMKSYERTRKRIDAIYASDRLRLPLRGVLLVGY